VAAAAVLPGRTGPLLSGCCTDSAGGPGGQAAAARAAWVPVPLSCWQPEPECLRLSHGSRSLSSAGHWHWQPAGGACGLAHWGLRAAQSRVEPPRRDPGPPRRADRWRAVSKPGIRISANPAAPSFRGYCQGSESKEPQSI